MRRGAEREAAGLAESVVSDGGEVIVVLAATVLVAKQDYVDLDQGAAAETGDAELRSLAKTFNSVIASAPTSQSTTFRKSADAVGWTEPDRNDRFDGTVGSRTLLET